MNSYEEQLIEAKAEMEEIANLPRWKQVYIIWDNLELSSYDKVKEFWMSALTDTESDLLPALSAAYRAGHADGLNDYPSQH